MPKTTNLAAVGDIRRQYLQMLHADVSDLSDDNFLRTILIDYLLKNVLSMLAVSHDDLFIGPTLFPTKIAKAEYEVFLESLDTTKDTHESNVKHVQRHMKQLERFCGCEAKFLAPVIFESHFFVLEVKVDPSNPHLCPIALEILCSDCNFKN